MTVPNARATAAILGLAALCWAHTATAAGFGVYFEYGNSWGEIDEPDESEIVAIFFEAEPWERRKLGVGLAFDSNLAKDKLFNYRLNLGYQQTEQHFSFRPGAAATTYHGLSILQSFGLGLHRSQHFRVWAGPTIRIGVNVPYGQGPFRELGFEFVDLEVSGGVQLGLNYHLGEHLTLSPTLGYEYLSVIRFDRNSRTTPIGGNTSSHSI